MADFSDVGDEALAEQMRYHAKAFNARAAELVKRKLDVTISLHPAKEEGASFSTHNEIDVEELRVKRTSRVL